VRDVIFKVLLVLATTTVAAPVAIQLENNSVPIPLLSGHTEAQVGELIRVSTGAETVKWIVIPEVVDYQEFDVGSLAISFREPGDYIIIAATLKAGVIALERHDVSVIGGYTPCPVPDKIPDTPKPTPPTPKEVTLADKIVGWCDELKVSKDLAAKVGSNFQRVANSKTIKTSADIVKETASLNKLVPPGPHSDVIGKVQAEVLLRPPTGLDEYRVLWNEIAEGFLSYSD
jgi:hypothetical protein